MEKGELKKERNNIEKEEMEIVSEKECFKQGFNRQRSSMQV